MSVVAEILQNICSFAKAAVGFGEIIERNMNAYYRMKDKIAARKQLDAIESVLRLFPQVLFVNGVFAARFLSDVAGADSFAKSRYNQTIEEFEKLLSDVEKAFDHQAPRINGLGSDMVFLFKQQIGLRRSLLERVKNGEAVSRDGEQEIKAKLKPIEDLRWRFLHLTWKYRDDSIREAAAANPELTEKDLAQRLDVSDLVVRGALRDRSK